MGIMDANIPSQRWALPTDSLWDRYENFFDSWVNENYDPDDESIFGVKMSFDDALDDDDLKDRFLEHMVDQAAEARAERMMGDY